MMLWGRVAMGMAFGLALTFACNGEDADDTTAQMTSGASGSNSSNGHASAGTNGSNDDPSSGSTLDDPSMFGGEGLNPNGPDPNGGLPGDDVPMCEERPTVITVELGGESYVLQRNGGELLDCCGPFTLTVDGCEPEGDHCFQLIIDTGMLSIIEGTRGDAGIIWGEVTQLRATNDPEIMDWPGPACAIGDMPFYYWVDVTSTSAINVPISVKIQAYVTGASCLC